MKRILAVLAAVAWISSAFAADLPTKAPAVPACTATSCSGWYVGGQLEGAGPLGNGQADLTNGAGIGGHVGYQLWNGSFFAAAEFGATGYFGQSTFTPVPGGPSLSPGHWSVDYLAKGGYGLQGLFSTGNATTPSQGLFTNLNAALISPYAVVGGRTRQFGTGFVSGAGLEYTIGNGWNVAVEYLHTNYNSTVSGVSVGTEQDVRLVLNRKF